MRRLSWFLILSSVFTAAALDFERRELPNGLVLLMIEDHKLPIVDMRAVLRGGSFLDPPGKEGLAGLMTRLLERGTARLSAPALAESIEYVGGDLRSSYGFDDCYLDLKVLSKDCERALTWFAEMALTPAFDDSEVDKERKETVAEIIREQDDPAEIVSKAFYRLVYEGHPYGHPPAGYASSVEKITTDDVRDFHKRYFIPSNMFLVVAGDFARGDLLERVEKLFGGGPRVKVDMPAVPAPTWPKRPRVAIIYRPEMNQAYIQLGHVGIAEGSPDAFPVRLMAFALGSSGSTSRIGASIRENQGLAYSAYAWFDRKLFPGLFIAEVQTKTESAPQAIRALLAEITKMKDEGPTARELTDARDYYIGHFPLSFDSFSDKVAIVQSIERYGLGLDYLDRYRERVRLVSLADTKRVAHDFLFPDKCTLVVVGHVTKEQLGLEGVDWVDIDVR